MPIKQGIIRLKYGSEAGTSPEAKKFLEREEGEYIISVSGLPQTLAQTDVEKRRREAMEQTTLSVKGRAPVAAKDVQFNPNGAYVDATVAFPRTAPITLDDKEVEFTGRIGTLGRKLSILVSRIRCSTASLNCSVAHYRDLFYLHNAVRVARDLLGKVLVHRWNFRPNRRNRSLPWCQ